MSQHLNDIRVFIATVNAGSVSKAANALKLNTTNILKKLAYLESAVDKQLFNRSTEALILSSAGEHFFQHCQRITQASMLPKLIQSSSKTLKLGTSLCIGQNYLQLKLTPFLQRFDNITMNMYSLTKNIDMHEQDFDLAVLTHPLNDCRLKSIKLAKSKVRQYRLMHYGSIRCCLATRCIHQISWHLSPPTPIKFYK